MLCRDFFVVLFLLFKFKDYTFTVSLLFAKCHRFVNSDRQHVIADVRAFITGAALGGGNLAVNAGGNQIGCAPVLCEEINTSIFRQAEVIERKGFGVVFNAN